MGLPSNINKVRGFLDHQEGEALMEAVIKSGVDHPCLEIGSYCGKSSIYLGSACAEKKTVLFTIDHHRGSEEHQPGEQYHESDLFDPYARRMDSLPEFRRNILDSGLESSIIPIITSSEIIARYWNIPLALVFIDGGHSENSAAADYNNWQKHIVYDGILAIHDIFEDPQSGGQAPYNIMMTALQSKRFTLWKRIKSLALLRCCRQ